MEKKHLELLAPAGGFDQLRYAVYYGANAVYMATNQFGLRARATNFSLEELPCAVEFAHSHGVDVHIACNALMSNEDVNQLPAYAKALEVAGVDAIIVSDLGALSMVKEYAPSVDIHVSTQASCANAASAMVWYSLGAKRIVCAREMSLVEIAQMRQQVPDDLEIEIFAHGAMCMAVSGRCLISDYTTGRSANKGNCSQACRWKYQLQEEHRPGQFFPIEEDDRGSYIMNAKDMNMLAYLDDIAAAGVNSIKLEGRNKKAFYVATVVNAYRQVLDGAPLQDFAPELDKISHRPYSTGFYFGRAEQASDQDGYLQEYIHVATVEDCSEADLSGAEAYLYGEAPFAQAAGSAASETFAGAEDRSCTGEARAYQQALADKLDCTEGAGLSATPQKPEDNLGVGGDAGGASPEEGVKAYPAADMQASPYVAILRCHNRIRPGDEIEIVSPHQPIRRMTVGRILWGVGQAWIEADAINRAMDEYKIACPFKLAAHDLIRLAKTQMHTG